MGKGYMGKILKVDLSSQTITEERLTDDIYEKYLSGIGLGTYVCYRDIPPNADPLGPENMLGFVSGLLTGSGSLITGRWMAVGKSPLTGTWGDANCGGNFSPAIKKCGYDGIFFTGISQKPVYLYVDNDGAQLRDAGELWGKDAVETEEILLKTVSHKDTRVACIGPAGENLSLISGICNDRGRIAARSGLGAVMGSKKLKALVLNGHQPIEAHDRKKMKRLSLKTQLWVKAQPPMNPGILNAYLGKALDKLPLEPALDGILYKVMLMKWGTVAMNQMSIEIGDAPIKNWKGSKADFGLDLSQSVNPDRIVARETKKYACYSCPIGCGGICKMKGRYTETHKPEYETSLALGGLCMNDDLDSIFQMNEILNRAGMDTISAGNTVAFALECYERGLLTLEDTDGLELTWGNSEAILALIEKMVHREGVGDLLADGVKVAARKIGRDAPEFAPHSGGQELAMHDGRNDPGFALHYSVEPTPGRHTMGSQLYYDMFQLWRRIPGLPKAQLMIAKDSKYLESDEKAVKAAACSKFMNVANGAGLCLFGALMGVHRVPLFEWLNAATGWDKSPEAYLAVGERIQTLKQAFNIRQGIDPKQHKPNARALGVPPLTEGSNKGRRVYLNKMIKDYWIQFDWHPETGRPLPNTLERLGITAE